MDNAISAKIQAFFSAYPEHTFKKGDTLIAGYDDPPGVIQLTSGTISQYDIGKSGQKVVVTIFRPPAFMPMSWVINKTPNTYFFEAAEDGAYRLAPPDKTVSFLIANPDVLLDLLGRVYRGTDGVLKRMTLLMSDDARSRLVFELVVACRRFSATAPDQSSNQTHTLHLKGSDLAAYTGLSRETVSRILKKLKAENLVSVDRGELTVKRLDVLEQELTR